MRVLMLRGLAREKRHWGTFPRMFAERLGAQVHTLDLAGFGTESARLSPTSIQAITDDTRARFLAERPPGDGPWMLLAISLGGMVALDWAARFPADFNRVVVINTSSALSSPFRRFRPGNYPRIVRAITATDALDRERSILKITVNRTDLDREAIAREWAAWAQERRPQHASFARQLYAATRSKLPKKIEIPVLVLASTADRLVSYRCSERIARALDAKLALHHAGGHDLSIDAPEWLCDESARFIQG
jgi:pimeloyl-ACP methyl ester carboxylesterase